MKKLVFQILPIFSFICLAAAFHPNPSNFPRNRPGWALSRSVYAPLSYFRASDHSGTNHDLRLRLDAAPSLSSPLSPHPYDYDVIIVGGGVGGHGAALQAAARGLKAAILTGKDVGGTCVNRGCVPSKALLSAAHQIQQLKDSQRLKAMGIRLNGEVAFTREGVAGHAAELVRKIRQGLLQSLKGHGIDLIDAVGTLKAANTLVTDNGQTLTAHDIILAPGSLPIVPKGIEIDGKTVFTSDEALLLEDIPPWVAIVGSGYIGLEFSDIFTSLGSQVTFIEAFTRLMPTFDKDIAKIAERLLVKERAVDYRVGVLASRVVPGKRGESPVTIHMIDGVTKEPVETLQVDACMVATGRKPNTESLGLKALNIQTERGFIQCDDHMRVLNCKGGEVIPHLYCIGDANGKMMLAHAASAQGISAIENIVGHSHCVRHEAIPAACFTNPEISFVGLGEEEAKGRGKEGHYEVGTSTSHFRANTKALSTHEGDGIVKLLFRKDTFQLLGAHIIGPHASDLIQECANAIASEIPLTQLAYNVHTHPTLSEAVQSAFQTAVGLFAH